MPPRSTRGAEHDKQLALRHAAKASAKRDQASAAADNAILFAASLGASLREIAEATGISHMTVKRIIDRAPPSAPDRPS